MLTGSQYLSPRGSPWGGNPLPKAHGCQTPPLQAHVSKATRSAPKELTEQRATRIPPPNPPKSPYNQTWHFEKAPQIQRLKRAAFPSSRGGKSQLIEETEPSPAPFQPAYLFRVFFSLSLSPSLFFFVLPPANIRKRKCKLIWWGTAEFYDAPQLVSKVNPIAASRAQHPQCPQPLPGGGPPVPMPLPHAGRRQWD